MILEAFAEYLHEADPEMHASDVLAKWLMERLNDKPEISVNRVIQIEIELCNTEESLTEDSFTFTAPGTCQLLESQNSENSVYVFKGSSKSGATLLKSLEEYSKSYENQKWARWVHDIKASDFSTPPDNKRNKQH